MQQLLDVLIAHGYLTLFAWVMLGQLGLPLPAVPTLLAAGALSGLGKLDLWTCIACSVVGSLFGDGVWFWLGRSRGRRVMKFLCRVSLEPEACVRRTEEAFVRHRVATMLFGKFVPGLATLAPPMAGMIGMPWRQFLLLDLASAVVWTLVLLLPGYVFSDQLERIAEHAALTGTWLLAVFGGAVLLFAIVKIVRRQAFLRGLRVARIQPDELHRLLTGEPQPFVVDLRRTAEFASDPWLIPGARHLEVEELELHHGTIPRDREIVLYCT